MKKETVDFTIIMTGPHQIPVGKKIHIHKEGELYYASSEGKDFGLVKESTNGTPGQVDMLEGEFDGIVTENDRTRWQMTVRVPLQNRKHSHSFQSL